MSRKIKIIIAIIIIAIIAAAGIFAYNYYRNEQIRESKEHFKKAETLYKDEEYDKAINEYSMIHKWDEENYKLKAEKISTCKTNQESLGYIEEAKKYEKDYNYPKALETYQKVSELDSRYYPTAQNSANQLKTTLDNAEFILKYTKSIEKKFGFKNKDIEIVYFAKDSGFFDNTEVVVQYKGRDDRLYIVTEKKPDESDYMTIYKVKEAPKYVSVWGEVQQETGWLSYSINSLREMTAETMIDSFEAIDTKADDTLLNYIQKN